MPEGDAIRRLDDLGDRLRVVTRNWMDLSPHNSRNVLTEEYADLFVSPVTGVEFVRVGTAAHMDDSEGWLINGANGIYAEVPLIERDLTDAEVTWCEETFMYGGDNLPESVFEFTIPKPEPLRAAIRDQDLSAFDCLDAVIDDADHRHRALTTLQKNYETENVRSAKLSSRKGYPIDLAPECDPENGHNDDRTQEHLRDMASMRADAHLSDFETVAGFEYRAFFDARRRVLDVHEPKLESYDLVALDVAGYPDWSYCRQCGGVAPADRFLHVDLWKYERSDEHDAADHRFRLCDRCADREVEMDHSSRFDEQAVAAAKDRRAQEHGGQRRLGGEYP